MPDSTASDGVEGQALSTYRLARAHVIRAVGALSLVLGVLWLLVALLDTSVPTRLTLSVVTVVIAAVCALLLLRPPAVLRLTRGGYGIALVRGAGVKEAEWVDVASVATAPVGGAVALVLTLNDGQTSTLPLSLLGAQQVEAQRDVRRRLNSAHGYRRLTQP
ncbi:MAG: hypothetical protein H0V02_03815 [Nocardioidaceae bacterium]|nr:hypothetical protein [Nocardioidaceae bacterium]